MSALRTGNSGDETGKPGKSTIRMTTEDKGYTVLSHKEIFHGRVIDVFVDEIEYSSGIRGIREVARHPGGAVVVGVFPDESVILVRQFRIAIDAWLWELPAGKLDPGEDPLEAARREFHEETGYSAAEMRILAKTYSTPGFCTEILHIYMATGLQPEQGGQKLEAGEHTLTVHRFPMKKVIEMIDHGEITDGKTICGILIADRRLHTQ
jgi:ADP-ribose pyrophosphatase